MAFAAAGREGRALMVNVEQTYEEVTNALAVGREWPEFTMSGGGGKPMRVNPATVAYVTEAASRAAYTLG